MSIVNGNLLVNITNMPYNITSNNWVPVYSVNLTPGNWVINGQLSVKFFNNGNNGKLYKYQTMLSTDLSNSSASQLVIPYDSTYDPNTLFIHQVNKVVSVSENITYYLYSNMVFDGSMGITSKSSLNAINV